MYMLLLKELVAEKSKGKYFDGNKNKNPSIGSYSNNGITFSI
jgi:hypothetical protein